MNLFAELLVGFLINLYHFIHCDDRMKSIILMSLELSTKKSIYM